MSSSATPDFSVTNPVRLGSPRLGRTELANDRRYAQMKKYKLVFLGEQSVGKTSLITRFVSSSPSFCKLVCRTLLQGAASGLRQ